MSDAVESNTDKLLLVVESSLKTIVYGRDCDEAAFARLVSGELQRVIDATVASSKDVVVDSIKNYFEHKGGV